MKRFDGKSVIVVGAGSIGEGWSNGRASAVCYAREGANVACIDRQSDRAKETADLIRNEGGSAIWIEADATKEADLKNAFNLTLAEFGKLDVLHNNVGVGNTAGGPDEIAPDDWDREIAQNLTSAYLGIRCAVPLMRERGGVIINTSSTLSVRFLNRPTSAYTSAKAAVEALTRSCAIAYGRNGIRVNCVRIGFSETPLMHFGLDARKFSPERKQVELQKSRAKVPLMQQHGDAFDVAAAALFLASDEAKHVTGAVLSVDGGLESAPL